MAVRPFFATGFTPGPAYNGRCGTREGESGHDGGVSGQRVPAQRSHGLHSPALHGASCGHPAAAEAVSGGITFGRAVCIRGVSPGTHLSGSGAGKGCGGSTVGPDRLWRRDAAAALDTAVCAALLRYGGMCTGAGTGGGRRTGGERGFLHGCGCPCPAVCGHGCLHSDDGGLSGCRPSRRDREAAAGAAVCRREERDADCAVGQRQRSAGSRRREACAGIGPGCRHGDPAAGGSTAVHSGSSALPCRASGAAASGGSGAASQAFAISRGERRRAAGDGGIDMGGSGRIPV